MLSWSSAATDTVRTLWGWGVSKHPKQNVFCRVSVFVGLGVLVVATPVSFIFINKLTNLQGDMLAHTDRRIALVNQLLAGMKSLKMYAWEAAQEARVRLSSVPFP